MDTVSANYNLTLVGMSYIISVFGAYTALQLAIAIPTAQGRSVFGWVAAAALAMGGGAIWSMHFIAMIAYQSGMPVAYDALLTFASLGIAVLVTGVGLFVVGRGEPSVLKLVSGGAFAGLGVAGMHYTGMAAMLMQASISYDMTLLILSLVIAVVAAIVALWLAFNLRGNLQRFGSALVMGVAVCGMHYTGMAALILTPTEQTVNYSSNFALSSQDLATYVFAISTVLLTMLLILSGMRSSRQALAMSKVR